MSSPHPELPALVVLLACPLCSGSLVYAGAHCVCTTCGNTFPVREGKVFFTRVPDDFVDTGEHGPTRFNQDTWSIWRKNNFLYFKERLSNVPAHSSILDLGIGPDQFGDLTERFAQVVGMDFRPYEPVDVVGDITKKLPFKNASFDAIILSNVLEHIPNTEDALKEARRVLRPGGYIIGTIPFMMRMHQRPYDFNRYTNVKLELLLREAGFKDVFVESLSSPWDVYMVVQRHFFFYVLGTRFSQNTIMHHIKKFFAKLAWWLERILFVVFARLYRAPERNPDFTQGFGFFARNK